MPSRRHSSEMLCSPRSPSRTIRTFSSGANFLRARRWISRTAASVGLLLLRHIEALQGVLDPMKCLLA